jgi:predicted porin
MTKKLLPTMIGALLVGGMAAAQADVTVMGHIDTSVDAIDNDVTGLDDTNLNCTTCSVGFKGSEDLGNGLKAIFKLDFQFDAFNVNEGGPKGNGGAITDRDQWVGLAGGFGQIRAGSISTVYKSHGAMIDPLYRTALQGRSHGLQSSFHSKAGEELEGRADNTIRWDSADFSGVKLGAHYTLDTGTTPEDENPFGIGASYENGGILVFADWMDNGQGGAGEDSVWKIGGKYTMGDIAVMAQYEDEEYGNAGGEFTVWHVAGSYTMGNNMIYAGFGNTEDEDNGGANEDTDAWTIALMHSMSKRTKAYVGYNNQEDDVTNSEYDEFSVGIKHKF